MADSDLPARRGDDLYFRFECLNADGSPFNLTGSTLTFKVYHSAGSFEVAHADLTINNAGGTVEGWVLLASIATLPYGALTRYELDREIGGHHETLAHGFIVVEEGR